ncbi:hypothetical protein GTA08_BOTSDO04221 [Botryosphaeria dothidea]|uniref:Uncharacterized protein n=1 Tax=Botryosphaeria dothidea TaxID=55169 RepID=A0A8H4IYE6_9PEZI|nr:hypothetical protein GTA08_BOTSDO04221 [Botryosphaeria dothidea]
MPATTTNTTTTTTTTTATSTATTKRRSLPTNLLSGRAHGPDAGRAPPTAAAARRSRAAPYTTVTEAFDDDDDDDGIPLMPLTRVQSAWQPAPPPAVAAAYDDELGGKKGKGKGRRGGAAKRRVYRYVSHGIGGAGNFRKVLSNSFRADITTTDPSFARNAVEKEEAMVSRGVCACSRCFANQRSSSADSGSGRGGSGSRSQPSSSSSSATRVSSP